MKTFNSTNLHDIVEVKVIEEVINSTRGGAFSVTKYRFKDRSGNIFTVNAFNIDQREGNHDT